MVELNHLRAESVFRQGGNILRAGIVQRLGDPVDGRGIPPRDHIIDPQIAAHKHRDDDQGNGRVLGNGDIIEIQPARSLTPAKIKFLAGGVVAFRISRVLWHWDAILFFLLAKQRAIRFLAPERQLIGEERTLHAFVVYGGFPAQDALGFFADLRLSVHLHRLYVDVCGIDIHRVFHGFRFAVLLRVALAGRRSAVFGIVLALGLVKQRFHTVSAVFRRFRLRRRFAL